MPFYCREVVIIPLIIIVGFLAWQRYIYGVMDYRPDPNLTESAEVLFDFIDESDILKIIVENGKAETYVRDGRFHTKPIALENHIPSSAIKNIDASSINI